MSLGTQLVIYGISNFNFYVQETELVQPNNICFQVSNYCSSISNAFPKNNYYVPNRKGEFFKSAISLNASYLRIKFSISLYSIYPYLRKTKSVDNCYLLTLLGRFMQKVYVFVQRRCLVTKFHGFLQAPAN